MPRPACALPLPRILTATALWPLPDAQDNCVFKISQDGVLEFNSPNSPPDYDDAEDVDGNNVYNVVVQATDGDAGDNAALGTAATEEVQGVNMVDDDDTRRWFKVIVNVQDINEPGSIRMHHTAHRRRPHCSSPRLGLG